MRRACDIGKKNRLDPALRRYTLGIGSVFALIGLLAGFYFGFGFVTDEKAAGAPLFEKIFLNTFLAVSMGAAGLIFGAFIGSTIYRFKEKPPRPD